MFCTSETSHCFIKVSTGIGKKMTTLNIVAMYTKAFATSKLNCPGLLKRGEGEGKEGGGNRERRGGGREKGRRGRSNHHTVVCVQKNLLDNLSNL